MTPIANNFGVERVVLFGFGAVIAVIVLDLFLIAAGRAPWGHWVRAWSHRYPVFAAAMALVAGGLVGHFFFAT